MATEADANANSQPDYKKPRIETNENTTYDCPPTIEDRLSQILRCTVCLDLSVEVTIYQCPNGHLICAICLSHLLADARLRDEPSTCPTCRCDISTPTSSSTTQPNNLTNFTPSFSTSSRSPVAIVGLVGNCQRNLAVEKAIAELPAACRFCSALLPRATLSFHEESLCTKRATECKFGVLGCDWTGPLGERCSHEDTCVYGKMSGEEIVRAMQAREGERTPSPSLPATAGVTSVLVESSRPTPGASSVLLSSQMKGLMTTIEMLSADRIAFVDLQLRPTRSDDAVSLLFYESSRFPALGLQWSIRARINKGEKYPYLQSERLLSYQLHLHTRLPAANSVLVPGSRTNPVEGNGPIGVGVNLVAASAPNVPTGVNAPAAHANTTSPSIDVAFFLLRGPSSGVHVRPAVYRVELRNDRTESADCMLPLDDANDCNRLLAARIIQLRLALFLLALK